MNRYLRQITLPEIGPEGQRRLAEARILMVGAGGLGAAALPYLAGAGIGNITIVDHDTVSITNLHRQTIYTTAQENENKAALAAAYLQNLNPDISVRAVGEKLTPENMERLCAGYDLLLDGTDNFDTKSLLNAASIKTQTPLLTASVNRFDAQIGLFDGSKEESPCYHCLFPDLPTDARNCNEAGILGTTAGITGVLQAHIALLYLLGIKEVKSGDFLSLNLKSMRIEKLRAPKNRDCAVCNNTCGETQLIHKAKNEKISTASAGSPANMRKPELVALKELTGTTTLVIDVRQPEELRADPFEPHIENEYMSIPLPELPARLSELPMNRNLALICAGNIRSAQGAEYLMARGFNTVCVLDRFSL
ncbi:MAG: ThiF family adenylyltransferase [Rhodospirillales bacterium]|nr:HesA/MoeB/ThiF family protein [Alphaproteobacteria bacterium]MCB1839800.1 HesA/MoeB/ThiF family protein [Alphaproteobacteria bacterium]MCB9976956.1 ThiF family adenylyltransferase [Rhodospirillales bacterium]